MTAHDTEDRMRRALKVLRWLLGGVIVIEAALFLFQRGSRQQFAATHMPNAIRLLLGWGELAGALLLMIPRTVAQGAWLLLCTFLLAVMIHLLHGMFNVGYLVIYSAAAWAVAWSKA